MGKKSSICSFKCTLTFMFVVLLAILVLRYLLSENVEDLPFPTHDEPWMSVHVNAPLQGFATNDTIGMQSLNTMQTANAASVNTTFRMNSQEQLASLIHQCPFAPEDELCGDSRQHAISCCAKNEMCASMCAKRLKTPHSIDSRWVFAGDSHLRQVFLAYICAVYDQVREVHLRFWARPVPEDMKKCLLRDRVCKWSKLQEHNVICDNRYRLWTHQVYDRFNQSDESHRGYRCSHDLMRVDMKTGARMYGAFNTRFNIAPPFGLADFADSMDIDGIDKWTAVVANQGSHVNDCDEPTSDPEALGECGGFWVGTKRARLQDDLYRGLFKGTLVWTSSFGEDVPQTSEYDRHGHYFEKQDVIAAYTTIEVSFNFTRFEHRRYACGINPNAKNGCTADANKLQCLSTSPLDAARLVLNTLPRF